MTAATLPIWEQLRAELLPLSAVADVVVREHPQADPRWEVQVIREDHVVITIGPYDPDSWDEEDGTMPPFIIDNGIDADAAWDIAELIGWVTA